jgi:hypothetical protein
MSSLTVAIPEELKRKIKNFNFINWSNVICNAIFDKIKVLEKMNKLLSKSTFTEYDSIKYGRLIKKRAWKKTKEIIL